MPFWGPPPAQPESPHKLCEPWLRFSFCFVFLMEVSLYRHGIVSQWPLVFTQFPALPTPQRLEDGAKVSTLQSFFGLSGSQPYSEAVQEAPAPTHLIYV
jgi:hypothetical protein